MTAFAPADVPPMVTLEVTDGAGAGAGREGGSPRW